VKYRLQFTRRGADDLEDIGGGGLLLQRFAQLVEQPVFSMAMTAWAAKFSINSTCFCEKRPGFSLKNPNVPIKSPSRSIGVTRTARNPMSFCVAVLTYSGS